MATLVSFPHLHGSVGGMDDSAPNLNGEERIQARAMASNDEFRGAAGFEE